MLHLLLLAYILNAQDKPQVTPWLVSRWNLAMLMKYQFASLRKGHGIQSTYPTQIIATFNQK